MTLAKAVAAAAIHLCASFGLFPDNTPLGPSFIHSSYIFRDLGSPVSFVNDTAGERGLQFSKDGIEIDLPTAVQALDLRLGTFAGPVEILAKDRTGATVATQTVPGLNRYVDLRISGPEITRLVLTGGGNEAILVNICISVSVC